MRVGFLFDPVGWHDPGAAGAWFDCPAQSSARSRGGGKRGQLRATQEPPDRSHPSGWFSFWHSRSGRTLRHRRRVRLSRAEQRPLARRWQAWATSSNARASRPFPPMRVGFLFDPVGWDEPCAAGAGFDCPAQSSARSRGDGKRGQLRATQEPPDRFHLFLCFL